MSFGFNAGKIDAVAGNAPLLTYFLPKSPKVFCVSFGAHSNRCLNIKGKVTNRDIAGKSVISPNFKPKSKLTFFADRFAIKRGITYEHRNRKRNQN